MLNDSEGQIPRSQPVFNVPGIVLATIAALLGVHMLFLSLPPRLQDEVIVYFALFPARFFESADHPHLDFPGGFAAQVWTLVSYTFLHGSWMHVAFNSIWLLAFGTPVARRLGLRRFLLFYFLCGAIGGFAQVLFSMGSLIPIVGASAAISGLMGGAARFIFQMGGPLAAMGERGRTRPHVRKTGILEALANRQVLIFVLVWIGLNFLFGPTGITFSGEKVNVAWLAHLGGFLAGLLLFGLFEPHVPSASGGPGNVDYGDWSGSRSRSRREM